MIALHVPLDRYLPLAPTPICQAKFLVGDSFGSDKKIHILERSAYEMCFRICSAAYEVFLHFQILFLLLFLFKLKIKNKMNKSMNKNIAL